MNRVQPQGGTEGKIVFPERWGFCENNITDKREQKSERLNKQKENMTERESAWTI